ncbi:MAG: hypothetical protein U0586_01455 [Candidatus Brocadiaceae bacterium]
MKSFIIIAIGCVVTFVFNGHVLSKENQLSEIRETSGDDKDAIQEKEANDGVQAVTLSINFSDYAGGSLDEWLKSKGFRFDKGAKNRKLIGFSFEKDSLIIKAHKHVRGFITNESVNLREFSKVRVEWGIIKYPKDASYERKNNNEALSLYIFFGNERLSSGLFVLPRSPYFISLFLSENDKINVPYYGKYYRKGGRFVCLGNPEPHETVISEFDLIKVFQTYFNKAVPIVSGISLAVDTSSSGDGGKAEAFIKRIEFLK